MQKPNLNCFIKDDSLDWQTVSPGLSRKIIAYDESLMLVQVKFEKGAVVAPHQHVHVQITHVVSGIYEVEIEGERQILKPGDSFFAPSNHWHGVVCLEEGILIDAFSPMREDFV